MVEVRDSDHCNNSTSEINLTLKIQFTFRHIKFIKLIMNLLAHDYLSHKCLNFQIRFLALEMSVITSC